MLAREYRTALTSEMTSELIEIVPKEAVPRLNLQLNRQATEEVMWVNAHPYVVPVETSEKDELERLAAGVKYRCIYARSTLDDPGLLDIIRRDLGAGEQARVIDSVPLKMGVVDRRIGLLPLLPGMPGAATNWLLVHRCSLLDALIALFETMWLSALPLDGILAPAEVDVASRDLASEDVRLLTLLLAGSTDEAVARQLGMSKRTVVRRVRQLMDRAGVASRMQLGWKASQLGWVDPPAMIADPSSRHAGPNYPTDTP
jgi:DNA-binding CsgD family transcriptional regulator